LVKSRNMQLVLQTKKEFESCTLLGYYAASSGNFLKTFRDFGFLTLEDGTDRLSRNVGKELRLLAAQ